MLQLFTVWTVLPAFVWTGATPKTVSTFGPLTVAPTGADVTDGVASSKWWYAVWLALSVVAVLANVMWGIVLSPLTAGVSGALVSMALVKYGKDAWKKWFKKA